MWKDIDGYNGRYQVSDTGLVRSVDWIVTNKNGVHQLFRSKVLKPTKNKHGYFTVNLTKNGRGIPVYLHRLIASAFIPNPNNYNEVNHINENPSDNTIENLEWCTHLHNVRHGTAIERASKKKIGNQSFSNTVIQLSKNGDCLAEYPSAREASRITGASYPTILGCCRGKKKSAGGWVWRYASICERSKNRMKQSQ